MAGKSDLVNGIVDRAAGYVLVADGGEAEDDWAYASLFTSAPTDGTTRVGQGGSGGGGGGGTPPPP